jgi:hypothetical protein
MKKKQVVDFFELFIKNYLVGDIIILDKIKKDEKNACTIPQAMAVLAGIDLLGYLLGENKDTNDTKTHFSEFFRIVNNPIMTENYDEQIIEKLVLYRHGMMHHFFPNFKAKVIGICKRESQELFIQETFNSIQVESLNVSVLTRDFLFSVSTIENLINENSGDSFFDNILTALPDIEISNTLVPTTAKNTTTCIVPQNKRKKK